MGSDGSSSFIACLRLPGWSTSMQSCAPVGGDEDGGDDGDGVDDDD